MLLLAKFWFTSGLSCPQRTAAVLYTIPLLGDVIQFIVIDGLQKFRTSGRRHEEQQLSEQLAPGAAALHLNTPSSSDGSDAVLQDA